jgi:hypothetical protein
MNAAKATSNPDDDLRYCLAWTAGNKKGRPKKNTRQKSVVDLIPTKSASRERECSAISVRSSITPQKNPLNQLQTIGEAMESEAQEGCAD